MIPEGCLENRTDVTYFILNRDNISHHKKAREDKTDIPSIIRKYPRLEMIVNINVPVYLYNYSESTKGTIHFFESIEWQMVESGNESEGHQKKSPAMMTLKGDSLKFTICINDSGKDTSV